MPLKLSSIDVYNRLYITRKTLNGHYLYPVSWQYGLVFALNGSFIFIYIVIALHLDLDHIQYTQYTPSLLFSLFFLVSGNQVLIFWYAETMMRSNRQPTQKAK